MGNSVDSFSLVFHVDKDYILDTLFLIFREDRDYTVHKFSLNVHVHKDYTFCNHSFFYHGDIFSFLISVFMSKLRDFILNLLI